MSIVAPAPRLTLEQLKALIHECGLDAFSEEIQQELKPSVRAIVLPGDTDAIGVSRLGGTPDVPPGFVWPQWEGRPLAFVGQLRCEELAPVEFSGLMPRTGLISFFYEGEFRCWNTRGVDRGAASVFLTRRPNSLHRLAPPPELPNDLRFASCRLAFGAEFTLPPAIPAMVDNREQSDEEFEAYDNLRTSLAAANGGRQPAHRIDGHMDAIQDYVQSDQDFLLFQVDSDEQAGMMWGDAGTLYWLIDYHKVMRGELDEAWLEGQCS